MTRDTVTHATGKASLKVVAASDKEHAEFKSELVEVKRGVDYLLSGYMRTQSGNQRMSLGLEFFDAQKVSLGTAMVAAQGVFPPAEFMKYSGILFASAGKFHAPSGTRYVAVRGESGYYSKDPCWFDDLALLRVQRPRTP